MRDVEYIPHKNTSKSETTNDWN